MVIGHEKISARIARDGLPQVSLFLGPSAVGKRRLAEELARTRAEPLDILRINRLTAQLAREAAKFLTVAPHSPQTQSRMAIINLDGATLTTQNTLLKSLEEISDRAHVILLASRQVPETVASRAVLFPFTILGNSEVEEVLVKRGVRPAEAKVRAETAGGQLASVYHHEETVELKRLVLIVVRCFRERDNGALEALATRWKDEHTQLLVQCMYETATKRWRVFNADEVGALPGNVCLAILRALREEVRPRLVIHAQLADVLRRIS